MSKPYQLLPQFHIVEDLTVENHPEGFILVGEGLLSGGKVNDGQPGTSEGSALIAVHPELVGSTVPECPDHRAEQFYGRRRSPPGQVDGSGNSTHD
jgi:hypothetical protein